MSIEVLPEPTIAKLRSTQLLTSLPQIISELVQNSLDAGASNISIGVNTEDWSCSVIDNGCGIDKDGLAVIGRSSDLGRYGTSKAYDVTSLAHSLASCASLSCLEVASRTRSTKDTWTVIVKGGNSLFEGHASRWRRESHGTVVVIRDAFFNVPVRRKSHPSSPRTLDLIRQEIILYALVFPHVSFTLEDTRSTSSSAGTHIVARIPTAPDSLSKFKAVFGRALVQYCEEVRFQDGPIQIEGFISLHGISARTHQYLYINQHPLTQCDFHRLIEAEFSASTFSKDALDDTSNSCQLASRRSPKKSEKKSIYLLNITLPRELIDNGLEPSKNAVVVQNPDRVNELLVNIVQAALVKHGFRRRQVDSEAPSPTRKKQRLSLNLIDKCDSQHISWTDPSTGEHFMIDTQTGNSQRVESNSSSDGIPRAYARRTIGCSASENTREIPSWIQEALVENPTYAPGERAIPSATSRKRLTIDAVLPASQQQGSFPSRKSLTIGQVDNKFIACMLADPTGQQNLVLVDQHAADERVRVEKYLKKLCSGFLFNVAYEGEEGMPGITLETLGSSSPSEQIDGSTPIRQFLRRTSSSDGGEYRQVQVLTVPRLVSQKLLAEDELSDLIKETIACGSHELPFNVGSDTNWVKALRGAVMFNDSLSLPQSQKLIQQLSSASFPFICAHGRPSLVPLLDMGQVRGWSPKKTAWSRFRNLNTELASS
ncbi:hypothetical protein DL96DRAFT_1592536 [Flagelloscypha sp. PMI_526]|nr:hypothetical protein DL96DRAFT_1592536 [Flagelloscypha sp. PMI_526]